MVSTFQDGDPNVGHGEGYGPSEHKGDLQGIINSLDYIKDLGFNAIWMTPIFGSYIEDTKLASTGYYPTDYFNIDSRFGGNDKFRELVTEAHNRGIYIILDGVFGHHYETSYTIKSPNEKTITDKSYNTKYREVLYPQSLEFFQEVATYWIDNYEIDGWRLDVAKELAYENQDGNYLYPIREAVEGVCDRRRAEGKKWGILGYIVAEYWSSIGPINNNVYTSGDKPALRSAFDFPFRYSLVQCLAQDEDGAQKRTNVINEIKDIHRLPADKTYRRNDVYPNLFIDNHDTYRFGNLLRLSRGIGVNDDDYWKYHKLAIGILAVYTGPITMLYGDEIGTITDCWNGNEGVDCPEVKDVYRVDKSSNARTTGQIDYFSLKQANLHDYTRALLRARNNHPSMWRGSHGKTVQGNVYFNCKYDAATGDKTVFVANFGEATEVSYQVGGIKLYDFVTGEVIYAYESGKYKIPLEKLGTRVFQVYEEDTPITVVTNVVGDCAAAQEAYASSQKSASDKKVTVVIAIAAVVVVVVIVLAIVVVVHMKRKFTRELQDAKSNPLVDMSLE